MRFFWASFSSGTESAASIFWLTDTIELGGRREPDGFDIVIFYNCL